MLLNELRKAGLSQFQAEYNASIVSMCSYSERCLDNGPQSNFPLSFKLPSILQKLFCEKTCACLQIGWNIKMLLNLEVHAMRHRSIWERLCVKIDWLSNAGFCWISFFNSQFSFVFFKAKTKKKTRNLEGKQNEMYYYTSRRLKTHSNTELQESSFLWPPHYVQKFCTEITETLYGVNLTFNNAQIQ